MPQKTSRCLKQKTEYCNRMLSRERSLKQIRETKPYFSETEKAMATISERKVVSQTCLTGAGNVAAFFSTKFWNLAMLNPRRASSTTFSLSARFND